MNDTILAPRSIDRKTWAEGIEQQVLAGVERGTDFGSLVEHLPSINPAEILRNVDRLVAQGDVRPFLAQTLYRQAAQPRDAMDESTSLLPLPHPLDFEWRFTQRTSHELLHMLTNLTPFGGSVLLYGTPGVALGAMSIPVKRRLYFVGENNVVTGRLHALNSGAGKPIRIEASLATVGQVDAVVLDPPWYPDSVNPMLAAAAAICKTGGCILISLAPPATRASAAQDQSDALRLARRLGLEFIERQPLALRYETPFFERNALRAQGIDPPATWRRGDLLIFRKLQSTPAAILCPPPSRPWSEVSIGRMRLAIRHAPTPSMKGDGLHSIVENDVLPTVSRSDPRRANASIWTSGNRVFGVSDTQLVLEAALLARDQAYGTGYQPPLWCNLDERNKLETVGAQLAELASIEAREERGLTLPNSERASCRSNFSKLGDTSQATVFGPHTLLARMTRPAA